MSQYPLESGFSPLTSFQLKDELMRSARDFTRQKAATHQFLDAGRGNPNWVATTPREAYFLLGQFALEESKRVWNEPDIGGMPHASGIASRLRDFLERVDNSRGAELLAGALDYAMSQLRFDADAFIHELTEEVADNHDNWNESDFMLSEFVDRVGPRLSHLNGVLTVMSQLAAAPPQQPK